jgi:hypothetical protein
MKLNPLRFKSLMIASLIASSTVFADDTQSIIVDQSTNISSEEECGIDLLPAPKPIILGEVSYISGGICIGGVNQMKSMIKDFPLEIVLVEKAEGSTKENYIADVKVKIHDLKDNLVLDVVTDGPFLLVNLPNGGYQITAEFHQVVKTRKVNVVKNKHERVVFLWSAKELVD